MVSVEVKLVFSIVMSIFALVIWLAKQSPKRPRLIDWVNRWVPRFEFTEDRIGSGITQPVYIMFFLIWIPIVWLFD